MRFCIVAMAAPWGGAQVHTTALVRTLAARGHDVSIYQVGHQSYEKMRFDGDGSNQVLRANVSKPVRSLTFFDWLRLFGSLNEAVCIFPKGTFETGSWRIDLAARLSFQRYITIEHNLCPPMPAKSSRRHLRGLFPGVGAWWYRLLLQRRLRAIGPHRVVCVSHAVERQLTRCYGFPSRKLMTIRNGIDTATFQHSPTARQAVRNAWGIPDDALVFGAIGRLDPQKAYDVALDAFRQVVSRMPERDMRFVLVGEGPLRDELYRTARDHGLLDRFMLSEFTDRPWEAYSAFDIFLMPSRFEGLPLALLEAMACGCSPIAMSVGGISEVITDAGLGWLVAPGDESAFLTAMCSAAQASVDARLEMRRNVRQHVHSHFNAEIQYRSLAEWLERECKGLTG